MNLPQNSFSVQRKGEALPGNRANSYIPMPYVEVSDMHVG
jgi:hypothetical protein